MADQLEQVLLNHPITGGSHQPGEAQRDTRIRIGMPSAEGAERQAEELEERKRMQELLDGKALPETPETIWRMRHPHLDPTLAWQAVEQTFNPKPGSKDWELMTAMINNYFGGRGWSGK